MQQSIVKLYCFVVQTPLNMFRALLCPSSGARQTAVAASGFLSSFINKRPMFYQLIVNKTTIFYDDRKPEAAMAV